MNAELFVLPEEDPARALFERMLADAARRSEEFFQKREQRSAEDARREEAELAVAI